MTTPLKPELEAVPAEVWLRAWLLPIVTTTPQAAGVGTALWKPLAAPLTPMPKPYWAVERISGPQTEYTDEPLMWIHSFAETRSAAALAGAAADDRVRVLLEYPGWGVTLSDGRVVHCDWVEIVSAAHHEPYGAESVIDRFVSEYRFGLSLTPRA